MGIRKCTCAITVRMMAMFVLSLYQVADLHPLSVFQCLDASKSHCRGAFKLFVQDEHKERSRCECSSCHYASSCMNRSGENWC